MGAKRKARKEHSNNHNNVVSINTFQKKQSVNILPRNKNQEQYILKLLDDTKDIVFGIGPAGTGKTLLAVQVAVKLFKAGKVDKIETILKKISNDEFVEIDNLDEIEKSVLKCLGLLASKWFFQKN